MQAPGWDISKYEIVTDWEAACAQYNFFVLRATVGDYYTDPTFVPYWDGLTGQGVIKGAYHVVAPADGYGRRITAEQQMSRFLEVVGERHPDIPWILDCELDRGQSKAYITDLLLECVDILKAHSPRMPIIYSRASWWDVYVNPSVVWPQCDLWAARYASGLTGPWSDGKYKFRDWTTWKFWQWSTSGVVPGIDGYVDLNVFNGTVNDLGDYAGSAPPLSLSEKVGILWREAGNAGWNLEP